MNHRQQQFWLSRGQRLGLWFKSIHTAWQRYNTVSGTQAVVMIDKQEGVQ